MKNSLLYILLLLPAVSLAQDFKRNEFGTFAGLYSGGDLSSKTTYGQQYTRWLTKNIGVGIGTFRTNQEVIPTGKNLNELAVTRQEINRFWDVSLQSRFGINQHSFEVMAGAAAVKTFKSNFEVKQRSGNNNDRDYLTGSSKISDRLAAHVAVGYNYHFNSGLSTGIFAKRYVDANHATLLGLKLAYHFNVNKDSLGISPTGERSFGVTAGAGFCGDLQNSETGYRVVLPYAGIYFERQLSLAWKSRLELLYARRGASSRRLEAGNITYLESKFRGDYLQIPLLFENEFAYQWNLFFGPHASVLLNGKKSVSGVDINAENKLIASVGITAGISRLLNERLSIEARYGLDFINFSANPYATNLNDFRLGLRYKIVKM